MKNLSIILVLAFCLNHANAASLDSNHKLNYEPREKIHLKNLPLPSLLISSKNVEPQIKLGDPKRLIDFNQVGAKQSQFFFEEIEGQLERIINEEQFKSSMSSASGGIFTDFMLGIGKADLSKDVGKAKEIIDKAIEIGNFIDILTGKELISFPVVKSENIGQNTVTIVFNSAKIFPKYAELEVFIKVETTMLDFENKPMTLFFGATDIKFSRELGIISGKVGLLGDISFRLGNSSDAGIYLKKMSKDLVDEGESSEPWDDTYNYNGTFISFNCDGFEEMGIGGRLFFSRNWLLPADQNGNVITVANEKDLSATPRVKGEIQLVVQDFGDWLIEGLSIDHFVLKKYDQLSFYLGNVNLDLSSKRNPTKLPETFAEAVNVDWEGVYIETIAITLPEPFKRKCGPFANDMPTDGGDPPPPTPSCRIKISGKHLIIDQYGFSGSVGVSGQAPLIGGPIMDGEWGYSIDALSLTFAASSVTGFTFSGGLGVPILSKEGPLYYDAVVDTDNDIYTFDVDIPTNDKKSFPIWNAASVNLTQRSVNISVIEGEFSASASFSGNLKIGNPSDKLDNAGGSVLKMPQIDFEDLQFSTKSPYLTVGVIELQNVESKIANFPVTPTGFYVSVPSSDAGKLHLGFSMELNLMSEESSGIEASGDFKLIGKYKKDLNGAGRWVYEKMEFTGADLTIDLPQFYATGSLDIFEKDKIYGNGFSASLTAKILGDDLATKDGKFELAMAAIFGSSPSATDGGNANDNYRYWLVDGMVQSDDIKVPLFGPFYINGFGGGAFHHMRPFSFGDEQNVSAALEGIGTSTTGVIYRPNANTGLGLKFSTSLSMEGNLMNGLLTAIIRFDNNYVLQNVTFWGVVDILADSDIDESITKAIDGSALSKLIQTQEDLEEDNKQEAENIPDTGIKGKIGISFDFEKNFTFHGFASVTIKAGDVLEGSGSLDVLLEVGEDENSSGVDWHIYIGGYYENENGQNVEVPGFFDENMTVILQPVSVMVGYENLNVQAHAYFLTGTKIPGPPPQHPMAAQFFGAENVKDNRDILLCDGHDPADGTGIAFGASAFFTIDQEIGGIFGSCVAGLKIKIVGGVGFDLALLKYAADTKCSFVDETPQGLNGFRATGRVFAFLDIESGHVTCIPIPQLGLGLKIRFDIFKPSYFDITAVFKLFGETVTIPIGLGTECGPPCALQIDDTD